MNNSPRNLNSLVFYFYTLIYLKVVLNLSLLLLLNINAILKKVENQTFAGPQCSPNCQSQCGHSSKYLTDVNVCAAVQYIDTAVPELQLIECVL